jgi:hypothetical protein
MDVDRSVVLLMICNPEQHIGPFDCLTSVCLFNHTSIQQLRKLTLLLMLGSMTVAGCVHSRVSLINQPNVGVQLPDSSVTVFLLERDIPADIERLGSVTIQYDIRSRFSTDSQVKAELDRQCQILKANGAYRTNDGTYSPVIVSYLVFRYKKK